MTVVPAYTYTKKTVGILLVRTYSYVKTTHPRIKNTEYCKSNKKAAGTSSTDQAVKANNKNSEKSTLGDLDALSALKEKMEKEE